MDKTQTIHYQEYSIDLLSASDRSLVNEAIAATENAYAPYSNFHVGAAIRMINGTIVHGSNQENIAYPSGLCAERTALFSASTQYPGMAMEAIAIVARNEKGTLSPALPCGACRQVMIEQQKRQGKNLRVICFISDAKILVFESVECLLPFVFEM
ncbi:MAG: cytidine deaminase [Bacteroidales bacterium]|nr:cytidine deaminase [Bacteroidales bacterium]